MFLTLAHWIVRRYPHDWRIRYADEVSELLGDSRVTLLVVVDLLRGCVSEWKAAAADPEFHPAAFQFLTGISVIARMLALYASFALPAAAGAWLLREGLGPPSEWVGILGVIVSMVVTVRFLLYLVAVSRGRPRAKRSTFLKRWMPLLSLGLLLMFWSEGFRWSTLLQLWWMPFYLQIIPRLQPGDPAVALGGRRYLLKWANMELARCLSLSEKDPSRAPQLARAQAEVDRLNHELQMIYAAIRERRPLPPELTQPFSSIHSP